ERNGSQAYGRFGGRAVRLHEHLVLKCIRTRVIAVRGVNQGTGGWIKLTDGTVRGLREELVGDIEIGERAGWSAPLELDELRFVGRYRGGDGIGRPIVGSDRDREGQWEGLPGWIVGVGRRHRDRGCLTRGGPGCVDEQDAVGIGRGER